MKTHYIPTKNFCDISKPKTIYKEIRNTVELLLQEKKWISLLLITTNYIDAFAGNTKNNTNRSTYIKYIEKTFPQYFNGPLTPSGFYDNFRCSITHEFSIGKGYMIVNNCEINGELVAMVKCNEKNYIALNIDNFIDDFLKVLDNKYGVQLNKE